jgi:hypothetical protein
MCIRVLCGGRPLGGMSCESKYMISEQVPRVKYHPWNRQARTVVDPDSLVVTGCPR